MTERPKCFYLEGIVCESCGGRIAIIDNRDEDIPDIPGAVSGKPVCENCGEQPNPALLLRKGSFKIVPCS